MLNRKSRRQLLDLALDVIVHGIRKGQRLPVYVNNYPQELRAPRASFVTLHLGDELKGCIGSLEAVRPLVEDIAYNAFAAAFSDPRFTPITLDELDELSIHTSILSQPEVMSFDSEQDLITQLRPGIDGLILSQGKHRGTFLPTVWSSLDDAAEFLQHLKQKAGLPADYWSDSIHVERYTTESFP